MAFGKKRRDVLRRSVPPFEIRLDEAALDILWKKIGANLWQIWDECKRGRDEIFDAQFASLYEARLEATKAQDVLRVDELNQKLKALYEQGILPDLADQINALTDRRARDPAFDRTPRNWQEETVKMLDGAYKSFVKLRANGDPRAHVPGPRSEWDFVEIRGRQGYSFSGGFQEIMLSCEKGYGTVFRFAIPSHQRTILRTHGLVVKGFTLFRDEPDMRERGRFWISLSYEIPKPAEKALGPENVAGIAHGSAVLGIATAEGEAIIRLPRPDRNWKPQIAEVKERQKTLREGSRRWRKLEEAKEKKWKKLKRQQRKGQREVVARHLLPEARHFVVEPIVVRAKPGKLADASKKERGGMLGLNASASMGNISRLAAQLGIKAPEHDGSVRKHKLSRRESREVGQTPPETVSVARFRRGQRWVVQKTPGTRHEKKINRARKLRDDFLNSLDKSE